ncbi:hypothetical protein GOV14_04105 [Candidatus Pacearchaeota archaeon]|nr:hypothetical protein [Candidatus Pacearchaeota archaeon]
MKHEVYSCIKMLNALKVGVLNLWTNGFDESVPSLQRQYSNICNILKENLSEAQFKFVQIVEPVDFSRVVNRSEVKRRLLQSLMVSVDMTLAFLNSLDMDLSREITKKELELERKEEKLRIKGDEVESLKKVYGELVHIKRGLPEIIRSEVVKEIKKQHRGIEENSNPNTKSQQKNLKEKYGQINGLNMTECNEFIQELDNIEGVKCGIYVQESLIEFKSVFTPFLIEIAKGVAIGLITATIIKFLEKNKDKNRLSIKIGEVNIYQGDNTNVINEKLSTLN